MKLLLAAAMAQGLLIFNVSAVTHFVDVNSTNPIPPYTDWSTAATNIQDAIDVSGGFDTVLVTNGVYQYGGHLNGRVDLAFGISVQSVNGPAVTTIKGDPSGVRCVYIREGGNLAGFTLTGGYAPSAGYTSGGGVYTEVQCSISNCVITGNVSSSSGGGAFIQGFTAMTNCIISGNSASNGYGGGVGGDSTDNLVGCVISNNVASTGGGVAGCNIYNSLLAGNSAGSGGAAYMSTLDNCTLTGNSSTNFGAADTCTLENSIIYGNSNGNYADCYQCGLANCCTTIGLGTPALPGDCITNDPAFVNAAAGNYRLNPWSPCVDAGDNSFVTNSVDLDGNPRIVGGAVDMGAYELQTPAHYVSLLSTNPVPPYTSWSTAATNIQDAINAAAASETVLVTNGVYQYGGDSYNGSNRVDVSAGVMVRSVNGPAVTTIMGYQVPGTTNGLSAVRCVYIHEFGSLAGFTLTGGATTNGGVGSVLQGGGVYTESQCSINNCIIAGNASVSNGGGALLGGLTALTNCIIAGNVAFNTSYGGGVAGLQSSILVNCVVSNNFARNCGGVENCIVYSSLLVGNSGGSAAFFGILNNCTITGNQSTGLGAAQGCRMQNCIIYYNSTGSYADCYQCELTNCCTTTGLGTSTLPTNCISKAPGFVNALAGDYHLNPWSPCVDAGNGLYTSNSFDLDGNPRIAGAAVDMGAYETQSPLQVTAHYVSLLSTNPVSPYTNWSTAATNIQDAVGVAQAGEFVIAADGNYSIGSTLITGGENNRVALTNPVTLVSAGGPQGAIISGGTGMRCIYVGTNATLMGFTLTNGHTLSSGSVTNDESGGGAWCASGGVVSNCIAVGNFAGASSGLGGGIFGGTIWNCVLTNNNAADGSGAAVASLNNCLVVSNGWQAGGLYGGGLYAGTASNCTFTANWGYNGGGGAALSTLYNCALNTNGSSSSGATLTEAGGAYSSHLYHCTLTGNHGATGGAGYCTNYSCIFSGNRGMNNGGGAYMGYAYNCIFTGNGAVAGGGEYSCKLLHCVVVGNTATNVGGGCDNSTAFPVDNSIVYYNSCQNNSSSANESGDTLGHCCTIPIVNPGFSTCFTNEPLLVNWTGGDFHLQSNSPCINSASYADDTNGILYAPLTNDFDGNPRVIGSLPDVGVYEYPTPASILPYSWLWQYGLATDGSADFADPDGDGMSNYAEWRAKTNPTNAASALILQTPILTDTNTTVITWQSVSGLYYYVQSTPDLLAQPFQSIASNIYANGASTSYTDTNAVEGISLFYRVGVQ